MHTAAGHIALVVALLLGIFACENKKGLASRNSLSHEGSKPEPSKDHEAADDEKVSPPSNIAGTYLHCQPTEVPFDADGAQTIGCGLFDVATDARIPAAQVASNIDWQYDNSLLPSSVGVTVYKAASAQNLEFDAYYSFTQLTESFAATLSKFRIKMLVTNFNGSQQTYVNDSFVVKASATPEATKASAPVDVVQE